MMSGIEMNGGERNRPLLNRLIIGILTSAPRDTGSGNPIVGPAMRIDFFNDRIVETPPAETGHSHSCDTAIEGTPRIVPSIAAETVPEYNTSSPRFTPLLIPDRRRSGGVGRSFNTARFTQSTGVPLTA